ANWSRKTSRSRLRDLTEMGLSKRGRVGWLARSVSSGEQSARGLKSGRRGGGRGRSGLGTGENAVDAAADHLRGRALREGEGARVVEGGRESPGESEVFVNGRTGSSPASLAS